MKLIDLNALIASKAGEATDEVVFVSDGKEYTLDEVEVNFEESKVTIVLEP